MEDLAFYVSPAGCDDDGDGTMENPFASLSKAMALSRAHPLRTSTTVYIREGRYFFPKPLELDESDSNMLLCAFPGESAKLTGAMTLQNLIWEDCDADRSVKAAFIGKGLEFDGLLVNGLPQIMARYPDYTDGAVPLGGAADERAIKERSLKWSNPETGYVRALHEYGWGGNDYRITGKNPDSPCGLNLKWTGDNNRGSHYMKNAIVVENIFEELDSEKEWFYHSGTGMLYYYPDRTIDIHDKSVVFEVAACSEIFRLKGESSSNPIKNIILSGLKFSHTKRTMFTEDEPEKQYVPLLRGDWAVARSGVVYVENGECIEVRKCSFANIGGNAVFLYGYNNKHILEDNEMIHIGSSAIQVVGSANAVDDPSYWEHELYPEHQVHATGIRNPWHVGPVSDDYPRDITICNNHIHHVGIFEKQSTGVNLSICSRISISHNTIHKSPRSNINVNDGCFGGHEIAYNDIFDSQIETTDHGPFNSWGRDRFWSVPEYNGSGKFGECIRNYTNDNTHFFDTSLLDACQTTKIHNNRFHHSAVAPHTWGIDLDDGSSNYEIFNNLCLGLGIKLREGFERKVHNNIIIGGKMEIHVPYAEARDEVYSNIILNGRPWNYIGVDLQRFLDAKYSIEKNWYYNSDDEIELPDWHVPNGMKGVADNHSLINQDPLFECPDENNYKVNHVEAMERIGFRNFRMDAFGKPDCQYRSPIYVNHIHESSKGGDEFENTRI